MEREKARNFTRSAHRNSSSIKSSPAGGFASGRPLGYDSHPSEAPNRPSAALPGAPSLPHEEVTVSNNIIQVTDNSFDQEVLNSPTPVLVDYWAEWCGPCKMIAPALEQIAQEYAGRLKVAKLNIDENQATPPKFGIRGIPTLMLFKNGNVEATKVGALSKTQLNAFIDSNI
jgi:thioredoxin 1